MCVHDRLLQWVIYLQIRDVIWNGGFKLSSKHREYQFQLYIRWSKTWNCIKYSDKSWSYNEHLVHVCQSVPNHLNEPHIMVFLEYRTCTQYIVVLTKLIWLWMLLLTADSTIIQACYRVNKIIWYMIQRMQ